MCHFEMISLIFLDEQGESTLKQGKRKTKGKDWNFFKDSLFISTYNPLCFYWPLG